MAVLAGLRGWGFGGSAGFAGSGRGGWLSQRGLVRCCTVADSQLTVLAHLIDLREPVRFPPDPTLPLGQHRRVEAVVAHFLEINFDFEVLREKAMVFIFARTVDAELVEKQVIMVLGSRVAGWIKDWRAGRIGEAGPQTDHERRVEPKRAHLLVAAHFVEVLQRDLQGTTRGG